MHEQITVGAYIRVSTDEQAREGVSLDEQEHQVRAFADAKGWDLTTVYADEGVSGSIAFRDRPEGAKALAAAADLDRLIVPKLDRFGRDAADVLDTFGLLDSHDCGFVSVSESIDTATPTGRLLRTILAGVGEFERDRLIERTREAAVALARQGRYNGPPVLGYRFRRKKDGGDGLIEPVEAEVPIIVRIFREFVGGKLRSRIALDLEADGVSTRRGGRWRPQAVTDILKNVVYVGRVESDDQTFPGVHKAIIGETLWDQAQTLLDAKGRQRGKGRGRRVKGSHLFIDGVLRCGVCGDGMVARSRNDDYICRRNLDFGAGTCSMPNTPRPEVDPNALRYFEQVGLDAQATEAAISEAADTKRAEVEGLRQQAEAQVSRLDSEVARIETDYRSGDLPAKRYATLADTLAAEREGAEAEVDQLRQREADLFSVEDLDAEGETLRMLAAIRATVAGEVQDADGIEAVRSALARLFDRFVLHDGMPGETHVELIGRRWIEPVLPDGAGGVVPEDRVPLAATNTVGGRPSS